MNSISEWLLSNPFSWLWERKKLARDGHIELSAKRPHAEGTYLFKPAGKSLGVSLTNLSIRQPLEYITSELPAHSYISLSCGPVRGIAGGNLEKGKDYRMHYKPGLTYCRVVGLLLLPEFFDTFLNSRYGISPDEIARAIEALGKSPLIPNAAMILKQIGEASFTGDVGNIWIEAKALELVSVVLDWHRRLSSMPDPPLKEHDRQRINEAICYAEKHFADPLTLEVLAKQAAMSLSKFIAVFKTHTGLSAASYVRRIRMDKAMDMLKNTSAPLKDIAGMVGYKHRTRFSVLFREHFGVAPGEFRKGNNTDRLEMTDD
jgi:AraC-like DNA-binding protein